MSIVLNKSSSHVVRGVRCSVRGFRGLTSRPARPQSAGFSILSESQTSRTLKGLATLSDAADPLSATEKPSTRQSSRPGSSRQVSWIAKLLPASLALSAGLLVATMLAPDAALAGLGGSGPVAPLESQSGLQWLLSLVLHLDKHMASLIAQYGTLMYTFLWLIVFAETGLVVAPFLPGDSLLFAAGTFAALGSLNFPLLLAVFLSSAILGDAVNYAIGNRLGKAIADRGIVDKKHLIKTEKFYAKYGPRAIVLARFLPILRTFAPFIAGIAEMKYSKFFLYNVVGAIVWVVGFTSMGFFFGSMPFVQKNFTLVILGIIVFSIAPVAIEVARGGFNLDEEEEAKGGAGQQQQAQQNPNASSA